MAVSFVRLQKIKSFKIVIAVIIKTCFPDNITPRNAIFWCAYSSAQICWQLDIWITSSRMTLYIYVISYYIVGYLDYRGKRKLDSYCTSFFHHLQTKVGQWDKNKVGQFDFWIVLLLDSSVLDSSDVGQFSIGWLSC